MRKHLPFKSLQVYVAFERGWSGGALVLPAGHVNAFRPQELCIGPGRVKQGVGQHKLVLDTQRGEEDALCCPPLHAQTLLVLGMMLSAVLLLRDLKTPF